MGLDLLRDSTGKLPSYAWPGGYPVMYLAITGNQYCPECANQKDADPEITDYFVHWEGEPETCDGCGTQIESAYGVPEEEADEKEEN